MTPIWSTIGGNFPDVDRNRKFEEAVGKKIKEFRQARGWSQEYLASVIGTDKKQIQRVEKGLFSPNLSTITAIAKAVGRQPFEFFKVGFDVDVDPMVPSPKRASTKIWIIKLIKETDFLHSYREVREVVAECKREYRVVLKSSAVSGVMRDLVKQKSLVNKKAAIQGRYLYKVASKRKKK